MREWRWRDVGFGPTPKRANQAATVSTARLEFLWMERLGEQFFDGGKPERFSQAGIAGGVQEGPDFLGMRIAG